MKFVKNLTLYLLLLLLVCVAGVGIFVGFAYFGYHLGNREQFEVVLSANCDSGEVGACSIIRPSDVSSADYTFVSSNFPLLAEVYILPDGNLSNVFYIPFQFTLNKRQFSFSFSSSNTSTFSLSYDTILDNAYHSYRADHVLSSNGLTYYFYFSYASEVDFNFNVTSFELETYDNQSSANPYRHSGFYYFSSIRFFDTNGKSFVFGIRVDGVSSGLPNNFYMSTRTYFLTTVLSDYVVYQTGYTDGYSVGNSEGYNAGYDYGYGVGNNVGYSNGYNVGLNDANTYTFLGLIGAVVDAPVSAFTNLLNFEIFGFNFFGCLTGIITVCLVIAIIRFIMGKG